MHFLDIGHNHENKYALHPEWLLVNALCNYSCFVTFQLIN
ncbi:hypothetical protein VCHENC02_3544, partial [Vibrio harveyi]